MSNDTFFKCFKQNKIISINIFRKLGCKYGFFQDSNIFFQKKFLHKFDKMNFKNIC